VKYYIISGEASGDLHASNLVRAMHAVDDKAEFQGWGGDLMEQAGVHLVKHYRDLAFMGFAEVIANLRTILKNIKLCKDDILKYKPDAVVLIDYPGFNLRIAEFAKANGIKVYYYISPQVWAWKQSRVKQIKRNVDKMYVILPFEKEFYKKFDCDVEFVGHPLLDAIDQRKDSGAALSAHLTKLISTNKPLIALLPGSRKQEISVMLPLMLSVVPEFQDFQFVVAGAPSVGPEFYENIIRDQHVEVLYNETYDLLENSFAALVTSGTATLETALFKVPEVVCYKGNLVSYHIARQLIKVDYISLVNLVMDKEIVKELIQGELNKGNLISELKKITTNTDTRNDLLKHYNDLTMKLGGSGASKRVAEGIYMEMRNEL